MSSLCYRVECDTMVEDVACSFGLYYKFLSGSAGTFPARDLAAQWFTTIGPLLKGILSSATAIQRVRVVPIVTTTDLPYEANYDSSNVGTRGAEPLPPFCAMLFQLQCDSSSSRNNGHVYISGLAEGDWVTGGWDVTLLGLADTLANNLLGDLPITPAGANYRPVCLSRFLAGVKRTPPITFDITTAGAVRRMSQQRRRLSKDQGIAV